jgi:uncharacterized coiled-coil DUF342 family protein
MMQSMEEHNPQQPESLYATKHDLQYLHREISAVRREIQEVHLDLIKMLNELRVEIIYARAGLHAR